MSVPRKARVVVFGAAGYTGGELVRLLARRFDVEMVGLFGSSARSESVSLAAEFPSLRGMTELPIEPADVDTALKRSPEFALLCTPHEVSASLAGLLCDRGVRVIDLSGAFRLGQPSAYVEHYGFEHPRPDLLEEAVYGLPELDRSNLGAARLVAAPGCYPTASLLALAPLARADAIEAGWTPIIDATSGVSGAGRGTKRGNLFGEVSLRAYGVLGHRHTPEIERFLARNVVFTPHVGPYFRGILATLHVRLAGGWDGDGVRSLLEETYADEPFVRVLPKTDWPSVGGVASTNMCDLGVACDAKGHAVIVSAIDNLLKGAAGQAVQCLNIALGQPETTGLLP
ncbi:MAG: N-acetyl-gamma-glutamyl-phosphate reductase [Planctomycetota bacterium]